MKCVIKGGLLIKKRNIGIKVIRSYEFDSPLKKECNLLRGKKSFSFMKI